MSITTQFTRFAIVGLVSNGVLYLAYLLLTALGLGHKTGMTAMFALGVAFTFYWNKHWSFRHRGAYGVPAVRYLLAYAVAYGFNWTALYMLVDQAGYAHEWVQAMMVVLVAAGMFLAQRLWVFQATPDRADANECPS